MKYVVIVLLCASLFNCKGLNDLVYKAQQGSQLDEEERKSLDSIFTELGKIQSMGKAVKSAERTKNSIFRQLYEDESISITKKGATFIIKRDEEMLLQIDAQGSRYEITYHNDLSKPFIDGWAQLIQGVKDAKTLGTNVFSVESTKIRVDLINDNVMEFERIKEDKTSEKFFTIEKTSKTLVLKVDKAIIRSLAGLEEEDA